MEQSDSEKRPKVVSIGNGVRIGSCGDPDPDVIAGLERMLNEARSGALSGFVAGMVYSDGSTSSGWHGNVESSALVGSIEIAKARVMGAI